VRVRPVALVALAFVAGIGLAALAAPPPPASVSAPKPSPSPTAAPTDDPETFAQPLVAACAVARGDVYAVSNGGGIVHFDGRNWTLIDRTLRNLRAVDCGSNLVVAVGDGGRVVRIDPVAGTIASDALGEEDLYGVAVLEDGAIWAAGARQVVHRFTAAGWSRIAGSSEDIAWRAVAPGMTPNVVWLAGDRGALFEINGDRFIDRSIPSGPDLLSLGPEGMDPFVGAADGCLYEARDARACLTRFAAPARSVYGSRTLPAHWIAGELYREGQGAPRRVDVGLSCPLLQVFAVNGEIWVLAADGGRSGFARYDGSGWTKIGRC
jgi:hypothetical protein